MKLKWWPTALSGLVLIFLAVVFFREQQRIKTYFDINSWTGDQSADCAIVLTGGANRVREGFDLLSRRQVKKLIISGVHSTVSLREIFPLWPFYPNLQERDVILEKHSSTTFGNAHQSLVLSEALQCHGILLVTSQIHMRRALATFKSVFPVNILIQPHAVMAGRAEQSQLDIWTEVIKSLFYGVWAY